MREIRAGRRQGGAEIVEHLLGLRRQIALADQVAGRIQRHLARDMDLPAGRHHGDMGIAGRLRQTCGIAAFDGHAACSWLVQPR
jgi:hypothetical protein